MAYFIYTLLANRKIMTQKKQTLIYYPDGTVAKRIDDFLYQPINDELIIEGRKWRIFRKSDEIDIEGWLVRKLELSQ
jgi:hypothetical protein